ncbi:MFS general substrate transporter [Xylariaceae sp. FL0804]|nr:MFS general substrate transporter [Xylariaceae sp. FL0804]
MSADREIPEAGEKDGTGSMSPVVEPAGTPSTPCSRDDASDDDTIEDTPRDRDMEESGGGGEEAARGAGENQEKKNKKKKTRMLWSRGPPPVNTRASGDLRRTASNVLSQVVSRMTTRDLPEPPPPPDGGVKAWTQVACGWLVIFTTWGYVNSFGAFQSYYTTAGLGSSASAVSWIGSVQTWLTLTIGCVSGRALDAGLFVPTFAAGALLQVLGMLLMSVPSSSSSSSSSSDGLPSYWQLMLTQGVLTGIGGGVFFTPALALVATYFARRRALAVGLATTGNSAGGIVYPVLVRELLPRLGFAWTARALALVNLTALAVVATFMRPRLPPRRSGPVVDLRAFREPVYLGFAVGIFFLMWANYYTFYYIASYAQEVLGLPYSSASLLVIILNGAGMPFRVIPPLIADRVGPINVLLPVALAWVVVAWAWLAVHRSVAGYYVFTVFYGIVSGSFQCLIPTTVASITKRLDTVGTRLGMVFSVVSYAALTGPPIGGAIQGASRGGGGGGGADFRGSQAWAAASTLLAFACFVAVRIYRGGLNPRVRC